MIDRFYPCEGVNSPDTGVTAAVNSQLLFTGGECLWKHPGNVWFSSSRLRGGCRLGESAATGLQAEQQGVTGKVDKRRLSGLRSCSSLISNRNPGSW